MVKSLWTSKTFWVNFIAGALVIVQVVTDNAWISAEWQVLIVAVLNGILRLITNSEVELPLIGKTVSELSSKGDGPEGSK